MKLTLNQKIQTPQINTIYGKRINNQKNKQGNGNEPVTASPVPSYGYADMNVKQYNISQLAFGAKMGLTNQTLLKEISGLKLEKESLLNRSVDSAITEAKTNLKKIAAWFYGEENGCWTDSERYVYARDLAISAGNYAKESHVKGHGGTWKFFHGDGSKQYYNAYGKKMESEYYSYSRSMDKLKSNKSHYEAIVRVANESEENKQKRLKEIDEIIAAKERLISYQGLQDTINDMLSARGGVNDRIAGYQSVKDEINSKFVQALAKSKTDKDADVPPAVLLYGPTGTGKTTFLNGIRDQAREGGYAEVVDISSALKGRDFEGTLNVFLDRAKERFFNEHKRTIFLMNDAEKIFAINEKDAPLLGITLDEMDKEMLHAYGNNMDIISTFKALLDDVSKNPPDTEYKGPRSASTFFITTNYPHLIHPDLLTREGKVTKIAVGLADDYNLGEVLRFYFEKMNDVADKIKAFKGDPNYREAINSIVGFTDKGRANVLKMLEDGTIDKLHVDYENMPYEQIAKTINPNTKEGAFSNDGLRVICQNAFLDYLEQDIRNSDYKDSFFKVFINSRRDINPERLKKFNLIDRMIKDEEIDPNTLEQLLLQKKMGLLSEKQANLLQYQITKINSGLYTLSEREKNGTLSPKELEEKAHLENLKAKLEASERPKTVNDVEDEF